MEINGVQQSNNGFSGNQVASGDITKETFLQLLSTQLQHQDPLEPASDVEFIQQMATFAQLEQQQITNSNLEIMGLYESSINNSNALNIVGKSVKLQDSSIDHTQGETHQFHYDSDSEAAKVNIQIVDADGKEVFSKTLIGTTDGEQEFVWYGENNAGDQVESGDYSININLEDGEGNTFDTPTYQTERVKGVSYENGSIMVIVGDKRIPIQAVVEIYESGGSGETSTGTGTGTPSQFLQSNNSAAPSQYHQANNPAAPSQFLKAHNQNFNTQLSNFPQQLQQKYQPYAPFTVIPGGK